MRGTSGLTLALHQILRLPWVTLMIDRRHAWNVGRHATSVRTHHRNLEVQIWAKNASIASAKIKTTRAWSEPDPSSPSMKPSSAPWHPPLRGACLSRLGGAFCMKKYNIWRSIYLPKLHHNAAPAMKSHPPINIATKDGADDWSSSYRKCPAQCSYLFSTILFSSLLYYSLLCYFLLYSFRLYSSLLYFSLLQSTLLYYSLLHSTLLFF